MSISTFISFFKKQFPLPSLQNISHQYPIFPAYSSQVKVLYHPQEFYDALISQSSKANKRIILSSLYLGTGEMEKKLVGSVLKCLENHSKIKVRWLLDFTRASRGADNSRIMLLPLIEKNKSCTVSLFHSPLLRGVYKLLPERWNEIVSLQHMKIYIFDDSVIISGANLSNDYFRNRQDRYIFIKNCKPLADFYEGLVSLVSSHSFQLTSQNEVIFNRANDEHPYKGNFKDFCQEFKTSFWSFWKSEVIKSISRLNDFSVSDEKKLPDTLLIPTAQFPFLDVTLDSDLTTNILRSAHRNSGLRLATGYFNLTHDYAHSILKMSASKFDILCAHPKANGFLGAKGFAGSIPSAYTNLCKGFWRRVFEGNLTDRIRVYEYEREGWTFHGKGLWYFPHGSSNPSATLIGSPNFGYRSTYRDLETQLLVFTTCPDLMLSLDREQERLFKSSTPVSQNTFKAPDRVVPLWVQCVTYFLKFFF